MWLWKLVAVGVSAMVLSGVAWAQEPQQSSVEPPAADIIVNAPTCETPDAYFRFARNAAREAETQGNHKEAVRWWQEALRASRCEGAANPTREIIALASQGMALLYTPDNTRSALNLNAALVALLAEDLREGRNAVRDQNIASVFALREALSAKLGEPFNPTGSRRVVGRVPETGLIRKRYETAYSLLLRPTSSEERVCAPRLLRHPPLGYPEGEQAFDSVGAVAVQVTLDAQGGVQRAEILASAPAGNSFQDPAMEKSANYKFKLKKKECVPPRDFLISFRFRSKRYG